MDAGRTGSAPFQDAAGRVNRPEKNGFFVDKCYPLMYINQVANKWVSLFRGVAQSGSARALGAWGRRFKSSHPDHQWPRGQAVKTSPFHGGNRSSILLGVTISFWEQGPLAQLVRAVGS